MHNDINNIFRDWLDKKLEFYLSVKEILSIPDIYHKAVNLSLFMNNFLDPKTSFTLKPSPKINPKDRIFYKKILANEEESLKQSCYAFENKTLQSYLTKISKNLKLKPFFTFDDLQSAIYYSKHTFVADSFSKLFLTYSSRNKGLIADLARSAFSNYEKTDHFNMDCISLEALNPKIVKPEICICISGFLSQDSDHYKEWMNVSPYLDKYTDVYYYGWCAETTNSMLLEGVGAFLAPGLKTLKITTQKLLGSGEFKTGFIKAKNQARVCGKVLAHIIASESIFKFQTVSLVGFSLGSHIIKHCLRELFNLKAFDIIENVVLLAGATQMKNKAKWKNIIQQIVHGRIINVFSKYDEILNKLYFISVGYTATGAQENQLTENLDVSNKELGHLDYRLNLQYIFDLLMLY